MHLDTSFHDHEMDVNGGPWERWIDRAEAIAGHSLDGDNSDIAKAAGIADGYSLDHAYIAWKAGYTPNAYVRTFQTSRWF